MKIPRWLIVLCAVLFFGAALTFYLNRVLFPQLIKKIAVERAQEQLKRKVEIGSIHFNWVKGFIIDGIKIYDKDSTDSVFAQAEEVSFGIVIFPGWKHYRVTIPFINVRSPSIHLVRTGSDTWNFTDLYSSSVAPAEPPAASSTAPAKKSKLPSFELAWGGVTISDGKLMVDDLSGTQPWNEFFDNINLKLALSYQGISYNFTAEIPRKQGFVGAIVYYQPLTQNTQAQIRLKNIDTASYLSLVHIPDVHLGHGMMKDINLNISHNQEKTSAQGDIVMENIDITNQDQGFKGDIEIHDLDAQYQNGDIMARGRMNLSHMQTKAPGLSAGGNVQMNVADFALTRDTVKFMGSMNAQDISLNLKDRQVEIHDVTMDNFRIYKNAQGIQSTGNINTKNLVVQWPDQKIQGDFSFKSIVLGMQDENNITLEGALVADHFSSRLPDGRGADSRHISLDSIKMDFKQQANVHLTGKLAADDLSVALGPAMSASASSLKADQLTFDLDDGIVKLTTSLNTTGGEFILADKTIEASPQMELNLQMPLKNIQQMVYKGSITLSGGRITGLKPIASLDNLEFDIDFQNDQATINALSANVLNTNVRLSGTVSNFKNPALNVTGETEEMDLDKLKNLFPQIFNEYGLSLDGTTSVKVQYKGSATHPSDATMLATASFKHVNALSSKLNQRLKNISGTLKATPDSIQWDQITASFQNQTYTLTGNLNNFKSPRITTTLSGGNLQLKADLVKNNDVITINAMTGKYLNTAFDTKGTIALDPQGPTFNLNSNATLLLEDMVKLLPPAQKKSLEPLNCSGMVNLSSQIQGTGRDWKNYTTHATISSPGVNLLTYKLSNIKINIDQNNGKIKNVTFDSNLYDGAVHGVGSLDLSGAMPYDLALNIDGTDLHKLKMDSPLKMEEINGKFYLTTLAKGTVADFKNKLHATGSTAIRDGFLGEFNLFKGLLGILNDVLRIGQVEITDVQGNFTIDNQKFQTDNLRLQGPTIVLLSKGWVNFDKMCDLDVTVDLSSGVVPTIAHDVLNTLDIRIYDNIENPKFKKKISVPQVINSLIKNFLQPVQQ